MNILITSDLPFSPKVCAVHNICASRHTMLCHNQQTDADLVISVGTDSRMLRAINLSRPYGIPVLGINTEENGVLTGLGPKNWEEGLIKVLEHPITDYMKGQSNIQCRVIRDGKHIYTNNAMCLISILPEEEIGSINLDIAVATIPFATSTGAGVKIITPLGSALISTEAPTDTILYPEVDANLITFTASGIDRSVLIPKSHHIEIAVLESDIQEITPKIVCDWSIDTFCLMPGDFIEVYPSLFPIKIIEPPSEDSFYDIIREKYNWGGVSHKTLAV